MSGSDALSDLRAQLSGTLHLPGEDGYDPKPWNSSAVQEPAAVVRAANRDDVVATVLAARRAGLTVVPQTTGHAAPSIDDSHLLLDTTALDDIEIDADARTARVGPGARWSAVNAAAGQHGLIGLPGSTDGVGVTGYTLLGGLGWLTRPYGMASGHLHAAEFVDGSGRIVRAAPDGDVDALWACRGGGGVGVVTEVEIGLVPADNLHAGFRLWPIDALRAVAAAWAAVTRGLVPAVSSAISVSKVPPTPALPAELHGSLVVRVLATSCDGAEALDAFWTAMGDVPPALMDTTGPADAARLGSIHMDPPGPVPSYGYGRWLSGQADQVVPEILSSLGSDAARFPIMSLEVRHTDSEAAVADGAHTRPGGAYLVHLAGGAPNQQARDATDAAIERVLAAAGPSDSGLAAVSFCARGRREPDVLPADVVTRLREIHDRLNPGSVIRQPNTLT